VEAEVWPTSSGGSVTSDPLFLVNARLSERSYRVTAIRLPVSELFAAFDGVGAQTEADAGRLREVGCRPEAVQVWAASSSTRRRVEERRPLDVPGCCVSSACRKAHGTAGRSTHAGEETILARHFSVAQPVSRSVPGPGARHFERGRELAKNSRGGVRFVYRSEVTPAMRCEPGRWTAAREHDGRAQALLRMRHLVFVERV